MTDYIDTYYSRTLEGDMHYPALQDHVSADICVIGAGFAGIATALGLVQRGKSVVLLESRRIGFGASGRNGGFVIAGYGMGEKQLVKKVGRAHAVDLYNLTITARTLIRKRIKDYNIPAHPVGGQLICSWYDTPGHEEEASYLHDVFGENTEYWDKDKVRAHCQTEHYYDGLVMKDNFHMHPLNYAHGQAKAIKQAGGQIYEQSEAVRVEEKASGTKIVHTPQGSVTSEHVVFCGSAYFNGLNKKLSRSCLKVSTYVMVTEPIPQDKLDTAIKSKMCIRDTRYADDYYRILPDNSLLWGGRCGVNRAPSPDQLKDMMLGDLLKVYPQLAGVKARVAWSGLMGYNVYKLPHIGKFSEGIWYCTNFGGHGVCPTTAGGEVIASAIAEGSEDYKLFEPFGFAYTGGVFGPFVAQAVYHSWELMDKLRGIGRRA